VKEVNFMKTKRLISLLMAAVFTLGVMGLAFAAPEVRGTVAKIEGDRLTIVDDAGKQMTFKVPDPQKIKDLKVGDKVLVTQVGNSVQVTKEGG
jgi:Cu/Ag efflux protein CusF